MSKKILVAAGIFTVIALTVVYLNQGLFSLGWNYYRYRASSGNGAQEERQAPLENPFLKYINDDEDEDEDEDLDKASTRVETETSKADPPAAGAMEDTNPPATGGSKPTQSQISREYMVVFSQLEADFRSDLDKLLQSALDDYSSKEYGKSKLADIYLAKGETLEKKSDEKFNKLVTDLEEKLVENSLSPQMARDIEAYYKKYKESEKNRIIDKGMALLEN